MNVEDRYMRSVERRLRTIAPEQRSAVLDDLRGHFADAGDAGRPVDETIRGLGSAQEIAAEMGLPLLCIFLMMIVSVFGALKRVSRGGDRDELAGWAEGLRYGLLGFVVAGTFISAQYEKLFWIVVFLSIAMERVARTESVARIPEPESPLESAWHTAPASETS